MPSVIYGKYGAISGSSLYGAGKPTGAAGGGIDYGVEQSSINITHTVDGTLFTWTVNGYDAALQTGTFYDGSPWVAPASSGGAVRLTALTPATYDPIEAGYDNPSSLGIARNMSTASLGSSLQGYLPTSIEYHQALDIRNQFPLVTIPNSEGVISLAAPEFQHEARETILNSQATKCYSILTVLDSPPSGSGSNEYFRPSPFSADKTIYKSEDFTFITLPTEADVTNSVNTSTYATIKSWWQQAWAGENVASFNAELGRGFIPDVGPSNGYSADVANALHDHILSCFGTDPLATDKKDSVYALLQSGIDIYGGWKSGYLWQAGAGQGLGRRARISFFGALITNTTIKDEIAGIRSAAETVGTEDIPFQEDKQVHKDASGSNVAIWGDLSPSFLQNKSTYWDMCVGGNAFDGAIGPPVDLASSARNAGDPYLYIDGPAQEPGTQYMGCCSTALMQGYVLIMRMWPEFAYVAGNTILPEYIDRVIDDVGVWTTGDVCAPPDPRDIATGKPYDYYGVTWGDDGAGNCITNTEATTAGHPNSPTTGRHSLLHGTAVSLLRNSALMVELWPAHGATP